MMHDQDPFTPDRALLNPKFESYKLQPAAASATSLYALPSPGLHLRPLPDHARLSYAEVQERVRHNHLSLGLGGEAVYVNGELQVIAIQLDQTSKPTFHLLAELPQPVSSSTSKAVVFEYPTALALSQDRWAISDGAGQLYLLRLSKSTPTWTSSIERTLELTTSDEGELVPFRLHSVDIASDGKVLGFVSTIVKVPHAPLPKFPGGAGGGARAKLPSTTEFDYLCVDLSPPLESSRMNVRWKVHSHDLPAIRITFSRQFLSLLIGSASSLLSQSSSPLPRVSHKKFWDSIDPHSSVWTFDREAEGRDSTYGVLSLHLEKSNPGTKWPDLFAVTHGDEAVAGERELEGVQETVDPSELAKISESMEQWTQGVPGGVGASNEGIGQGVPTSLTGEEMDVEVDGETGRRCVVTWITDVPNHPPKIVRPHPAFVSSLLSTSLPLSPPTNDHSIVLKNDVDGLAFSPPSSPSSSSWTHTTTFPALSFILATKRDASFVHHLGTTAVFAFDSPSSPALTQPGQGPPSSGNLFVYFRPEGVRSEKGKQMVLRIGGPASGSLLGVGAVTIEGQATVVLALCENELVVYHIL
ncbi:hypothetical protein RQP46_005748 [Phenoliferia psychrophenolica]